MIPDVVFERDIAGLVTLGNRPVAEFITEITRDGLNQIEARERLHDFVQRLAPYADFIRENHGDRFAPRPLMTVPREAA